MSSSATNIPFECQPINPEHRRVRFSRDDLVGIARLEARVRRIRVHAGRGDAGDLALAHFLEELANELASPGLRVVA